MAAYPFKVIGQFPTRRAEMECCTICVASAAARYDWQDALWRPSGPTSVAVEYAGKNFGGVQGFGRPRRGSGGRSPPPDAGEFSKICKKIF